MTIQEAAQLEQNGGHYLIDETTAIVRFIFPCGEPVKTPPGSVDAAQLVLHANDAVTEEAEAIRWFYALFVQSIIQVINGRGDMDGRERDL
jgi:hypothetical protein